MRRSNKLMLARGVTNAKSVYICPHNEDTPSHWLSIRGLKTKLIVNFNWALMWCSLLRCVNLDSSRSLFPFV